MHIGIDIGPVIATRTGVGNYCYYLLKHLLLLENGLSYRAFSSGTRTIDADRFGKRIAHRHIPLPTRVLYKGWELLRWPPVDRILGGVDVYHATNYFLPPTARARRVVTIHDLTFLAAPHLCSPRIVGPFSRNMGRFAQEADAILAYSESTKRDIETHLHVALDKITVAPLAVDDDFAAVPREEAKRRLKEAYGLAGPYVLFVGTIEPRKNVPTLLRAFGKIRGDLPHRLVLAGALGWNSEDFLNTLQSLELGDRVLQTGYVRERADLALFYAGADLFAFPSFYEGFGLPVLEAMTCGCPVLAANTSSIPEVAGAAAALLPPDDADAWAGEMRALLADEPRREAMGEAGREQAKRFSWRRCAEETAAVYRSLA